MPVTRPLVIAAPTLAAWLALRIIAADYGPSERGADEAEREQAGEGAEGRFGDGREDGHGWPSTS